MTRLLLLPALLLLSGPALALDAPPPLAGGAVWQAGAKACTAEATDEGAGTIQLNAAGLSGMEFSCSFVTITPVPEEGGETFSWLASAVCSDGGGMTRPDQILIQMSGESLDVTSQNDAQAVMAAGGEDAAGLVAASFARCGQ